MSHSIIVNLIRLALLWNTLAFRSLGGAFVHPATRKKLVSSMLEHHVLESVSLPHVEFDGEDYDSYRINDPPGLDASLPTNEEYMAALQRRKKSLQGSAALPIEEFQGENYDAYRIQDPTLTVEKPLPAQEECSDALKRRKKSLSFGIGKRYVAHVPPPETDLDIPGLVLSEGIPVYSEPDPEKGQVIGFLQEGDIVSLVSRKGPWIEHTEGGWTLSYKGAFRFLQPVVE